VCARVVVKRYCVIHSNGNAAVYDVAIAIKNANEKIVQPEHSVSKVGTSSTKLSNAKVSLGHANN